MNVERNGKVYEKCEEEFNVVDGEDFQASKFGYRHQQCLIMFICLATAYSMRACIGVALVGMIDDTYEESLSEITNDTFANGTTIYVNATQFNANFSTQETNSFSKNDTVTFESNGLLGAFLLIPPYPEFRWSKRVQDIMISSFFWGYMVLQIPAGQLVHRFGPRYLLGGALTVNSVMSLCFPWASYYGGWIFAMICRIVQGLTQACIIPGMYGFLGQWTPLEERSRLAGFCLGGQAMGTVLGLPLTGFIAESVLGWPGIFRFYGILSGLVAVLVFIMVRDKPQEHPKISVAEKKHIEEGLLSKGGAAPKGVLKVPWKKILQCKSLYGVILVHISQMWGLVVLFAEIPFFMDKVLGVNIKNNGMLTALPFFGMWLMNFFWNWMTDYIIVKKWLSVTNARKVANSIGCVFPALGLVILAFSPKNVYIAETLLIFICSTKIAATVGFMVTLIDIAPNFASTLMSISNFVCNLIGSQAPMVIGLILNDSSDEKEWRKVFCMTAGLYFFANLAYVFLSSSDRAPWNDPEDDGEENIAEKQTMLDNLGMDHEDGDEKFNLDKLRETKIK